jgi:hypothetical protein
MGAGACLSGRSVPERCEPRERLRAAHGSGGLLPAENTVRAKKRRATAGPALRPQSCHDAIYGASHRRAKRRAGNGSPLPLPACRLRWNVSGALRSPARGCRHHHPTTNSFSYHQIPAPVRPKSRQNRLSAVILLSQIGYAGAFLPSFDGIGFDRACRERPIQALIISTKFRHYAHHA